MSRETAYRLRRRPGAESFAAAWDAVLRRVTPGRRKVTTEERARRAMHGLLKPVMYRGRHVATVGKADNSALLGYIAQLDRAELRTRKARERSQAFAAVPASPGARPEPVACE